MKILIVRLSSMGDVILATALFSFLRKQHPTASLTFLTGSDYAGYAGLFRDDPRLSEAAGIDDSAVELPAPLAASAWDLVIDLQNNGRSHALLGQLRTGSRTAFFDKQHFQRFVLLFLRYNLYDFSRHVAARYIRAAGGDPSPGEVPVPRLFFEDAGCLKARETFGITGPAALALFPFSAWKNKEWPESFFVKVGRHFTDKRWTVAIFGGPPDAERARQMKERIGDRCVSLAGNVSLYECGCLLKNFTLALGNDTGLSHLARACGVKTGILFGPTTRHFGFFPYGEPSFRIFEKQLCCRPCHAHGGNVCLRLTRACLRQISAEQVIEGMEELFNNGINL
ncbi:MAG: glycosyltransferase family 9 protein [Chitinispirillaceae bacterium]|jgi:heptosyltransferase-2